MNIIEKIKSHVHFNIPSIVGFILQLILACLWFSDTIEYETKYDWDVFSIFEFIYVMNEGLAVYAIIAIALIFVAVAPWAGCALTSKRRGKLLIPLVITFMQEVGLFVLMFLLDNEPELSNFEVNGTYKFMIFLGILCMILCVVSYLSIRKYQKSLKANAQPQFGQYQGMI